MCIRDSAYGTGQDFAKQNEGIHMSKQLLFKLNPDYMGTRVGIPKGEIALLNLSLIHI